MPPHRENEIVIPFSIQRCLMMPLIPFAVGITGLLLWDYEGTREGLPQILRNLGFFALFLALMSWIGYYRMCLVLNRRGLTIHYPLHTKTYAWTRLHGFRIESQTLLCIPVFEVVRLSVADGGEKTFLSVFRPSAKELVTLFEQWRLAAYQEESEPTPSPTSTP